jgi:hypothetical protein
MDPGRATNAVGGSLFPTLLAFFMIISACLILNATCELVKAVDTNGSSNNASNKKTTTPLPPTATSKQTNYTKCNNTVEGFSINYPSNWMNMSEDCSFFTPNPNALFSPTIEPFFRISVTNLNASLPIPPISEIESQVMFFSDANFFKRISVPRQIGANAFAILYQWTGDPQVALPYVNQSSPFPSLALTPLSTTTNSSQSPTSNNDSENNPYVAQLYAIYVISHNKLYVIEYSALVNNFNDPHDLQDVARMIRSFVSTGTTNFKPAYCNEPIYANSTACKQTNFKPAYCNEPIYANSTACKQTNFSELLRSRPRAAI